MGQVKNSSSLGLLSLGAAVVLLLGPANPYKGSYISSPVVEAAAHVERAVEKVVPSKLPENKMETVAPRTEAQIVASSVGDELVEAQISDLLFDGFLKFKRYELEFKTAGGTKAVSGGFVHGPGHHSVAIAAMVFDKDFKPYIILKTGDTRLSRADRNESYVMDGFIAGRMDKMGAESSKIALDELAEEVGGQVVPGTFSRLGEALSPTMPLESTESDAYFVATVTLSETPTGDGGEMELVELIGPKLLSAADGIQQMDEGQVSDASRARTLYGRAFDKAGYSPSIEAWVRDHPKLSARFDTLGLGEVVDLRTADGVSEVSEETKSGDSIEARVNHVVSTEREELVVSKHSKMVDTKTKHAVKDGEKVTALEPEFPNQYLALDYDRAKVAYYFLDPERGPMVQMKRQLRPPLALAVGEKKVFRRDIEDRRVSRKEEMMLAGARQLGSPCSASAGQSDLYYQFWVKEVPRSEDDFVTLAEAIRLCRTGHGDSQTEALLLRLAHDLKWSPNLGMSVEEARGLMKS